MIISQASTVHNLLEASAQRRADKVAFVQDDERVSYRQINAMANRLAACLLEQGLVAGDRVAILLENSVEYVVSYYGVLKAGGVAVPLSSGLKANCLARASDYASWCGTTQPITASFLSNGAVQATKTVGTPPATCSLTVSPTTAAPGQSYTFSVSGTNLPAGAQVRQVRFCHSN